MGAWFNRPIEDSLPLAELRSTVADLHALKYLREPTKHAPTPVCVVYGGDAFLKSETIKLIQCAALGEDDEAEISLTVLDGKVAEPRDVFDAINAVSLFGPGNPLVILNATDEFLKEEEEDENGEVPQARGRAKRHVTRRERLEKYAENPNRNAVLLLDIKQFPKTTRLAKRVVKDKSLIVDCRTQEQTTAKKEYHIWTQKNVRDWLIRWATDRHSLKMTQSVADEILEAVSHSPGLLDQELAKLTGVVSKDNKVTLELVRDTVGNWRTRTAWEMIDAALNGNAADAMRWLDRLLASGEVPQAIFPMLAFSLRGFATACRIITNGEITGRRVSIQAALKDAGVAPFRLKAAETQLRQLGRDRAAHLHRWLLDADLAMKGSHSNGELPRLVLEQLVLKLTRKSK